MLDAIFVHEYLERLALGLRTVVTDDLVRPTEHGDGLLHFLRYGLAGRGSHLGHNRVL